MTFEGQRCVVGLKNKDEKELGFWSLQDDCHGFSVDYLEEKEPM